MSIRNKLTVTFLFILLPSLVLQLWLNNTVNGIMLEKICQAENYSLNTSVSKTEDVFSEVERILTELTDNITVRNLIDIESAHAVQENDRVFRYEQFKISESIQPQFLQELMDIPFEFLFVPTSGSAFGTLTDLNACAAQAREHCMFDTIVADNSDEVYWMFETLSAANRAPKGFVAALPIRSTGYPQRVIGVAYITIAETYIFETLLQTNAHGDAYLIDAENNILSAYQKDLLLENADAVLAGESLSVCAGEWQSVHTAAGEPCFALVSQPIAGEWCVLTLLPQVQTLGDLTSINNRILLCQIGVCILCVFLAFTLAKLLSNPIVRLSAAAQKVQQGDLAVEIQEKSTGEIGVLERNFNRMLLRIAQMMEDLRQQERKRADLELEALQAQINPHFLFNTLTSIRWASSDETVESMIISLCTLLKASVLRGNTCITLAEEANLLVQYVSLNNLRHTGNAIFKMNLAPETLEIKIPRFLLQPFIENSILHGFEFSDGCGTICLESEMVGQQCHLKITDTGCGFPEPVIETLLQQDARGHSVGLKNTAERLMLFYGKQASVHCYNLKDEAGETTGAVVELRFPTKQEEE